MSRPSNLFILFVTLFIADLIMAIIHIISIIHTLMIVMDILIIAILATAFLMSLHLALPHCTAAKRDSITATLTNTMNDFHQRLDCLTNAILGPKPNIEATITDLYQRLGFFINAILTLQPNIETPALSNHSTALQLYDFNSTDPCDDAKSDMCNVRTDRGMRSGADGWGIGNWVPGEEETQVGDGDLRW